MLQNNLKTSAKYLNGYFLINNDEVKSKRVIDFMAVFKMVENEMFGDAIYDLNNRRNVKLKKPSYLPKQKDVNRIVEYCKSAIKNLDIFGAPITSYVDTRDSTHDCSSLWEEAVNGAWINKRFFQSMILTTC